MFQLVLVVALFAVLHFVLLLPVQASIIGAAIVTVVLWLLWKLRYIILGIVGLEMLFGDRNGPDL